MPGGDQKTALSLAERIDAACDRFEREWRSGRQPRIEAFLTEASAPEHPELFRHLLALECELISTAGQAPTASDYLQRFPEHSDVVKKTLQECAVVQASIDTSVSHGSVRTGSFLQSEVPPPLGLAPDAVPTQIGRFQVKSVLGSGAFGRVYRAFDPDLARAVAIKVPLAEAMRSATERERFVREGRAAATLHHPNVCPVYEVGEQAGVPYIVMALVPGQSLADVIQNRKEPLPAKQIALIVKKLATALEVAHKKGIVHRDLKPANIMFDRDRKEVVIMDFGLARAPTADAATATQSGVIMGTPAYMSPEQARGQAKSVGPAADIYSLGVILFELLTGQRPFTGSVTDVLVQIVHDQPKAPSAVRPGVDARLEAICLKAIAKEPGHRFGSMKELASAMDGVLKGAAAGTAGAARSGQTMRDAGATEIKRFEELFAERSQARKAETAAAMEAAVAKHRTPRWIFVALGLVLLAGFITLGIIFFARTPTATILVEVNVDLSDKSLNFILDGKGMSAEELARPVELKVGEHELIVMRGKDVYKQIRFNVVGGANPEFKLKEVVRDARPKIEPTKSAPATGDPRFLEWEKRQWTNLVPSADVLNDRTLSGGPKDAFKFENGVFELREMLTYWPTLLRGRDVVVRMKVKRLSGHATLMVRRSGVNDGFGMVWAYGGWITVGKNKKGVWQGLETFLAKAKSDEFADVALAAVGDEFSIYVDRVKVWSGKDPGHTGTGITLQATSLPNSKGRCLFKSIEALDLSNEFGAGEFTPLFSGKDLAGWRETPGSKANWRVENGAIVGGREGFDPGERSYLMTARGNYGDFKIRVEALLDATADSGVLLRLQPFTQERVTYHEHGYEVQMNCAGQNTNRTGGLFVGPRSGGFLTAKHEERKLSLPNEWFTLEMTAKGDRISAQVNGEPTASWTDPNRNYSAGHIGLQFTRGLVKIRKVEISEVGAAPVAPDRAAGDGFVALFNGKDFSGWKTADGKQNPWKVVDGVLTGSETEQPEYTPLITDRGDYRDVHVRVECKVAEPGRGAIGVRAPSGGLKGSGYSAIIGSNATNLGATGSLKSRGREPIVKVAESAVPADTWFTLEFIVRGNHCTIKVNGQVTADYEDSEGTWTAGGHIGLQLVRGPLSFRRVEVAEIKP